MQFLWRYIEDMVGKGLGLSVLGEMFLYAALQLIHMALPLSILLSSLMMFGNLGESLELLAVKSAGIPLLKIMSPLIVLITLISIGTFFYQNDVMPKVQTKFYSLFISIRQASPELDIPQGVFYKQIDGYNLYVESKNQETGMLYDVMIYDTASGFQNMAVIICDSAEMNMTEDKTMLIFKMYKGQQFANFNQGDNYKPASDVPLFARQNFDEKTMMISYDANFNRYGEEVIVESSQANYVSKDLEELTASIDSMKLVIDSVNRVDRQMMKNYSYLSFRNSYPQEKRDSLIAVEKEVVVPSPDTLLQSKDLQLQSQIMQSAYMKADNNSNDFLFRSMSKTATQRTLNLSWIEWHRKFTVSFACLVFFFIGAPLGSIVRKGGIGTPIVISVVLFIIYYILENVGRKMVRDGIWEHWMGMWFSAMILLPLGVFLTYKAMNDSVIMNTDTYIMFFKRLFFIREKRKYPVKEVVIENPVYEDIKGSFGELSAEVNDYLKIYGSLNYKTYWLDDGYDLKLRSIRNRMEIILNQLSNSRKPEELIKAEEFPVLISNIRPFNAGSLIAKIFMYVFPVGIIFKLISLPFERRICKDLKDIQRLSGEFIQMIDGRNRRSGDSNR